MATTSSVTASPVGVIIADTTSTATRAWRRKALIICRSISPIRESRAHTTGNSNTTPIISVRLSIVSIYDCSVSMLSTCSLT